MSDMAEGDEAAWAAAAAAWPGGGGGGGGRARAIQGQHHDDDTSQCDDDDRDGAWAAAQSAWRRESCAARASRRATVRRATRTTGSAPAAVAAMAPAPGPAKAGSGAAVSATAGGTRVRFSPAKAGEADATLRDHARTVRRGGPAAAIALSPRAVAAPDLAEARGAGAVAATPAAPSGGDGGGGGAGPESSVRGRPRPVAVAARARRGEPRDASAVAPMASGAGAAAAAAASAPSPREGQGVAAAAPSAPDGSGSGSDSGNDSRGSETDSEDEESEDSAASQFSTDCVRCDRHLGRTTDGTVCECCEVTLCTRCRPAPRPTDPPWYCPVHDAERREARDSAAGVRRARDVDDAAVPLICELPEALGGAQSNAAARGIAAALKDVEGWKGDEDLNDMLDDLADTLGFAPKGTSAKGQSSVRRFDEFVKWMPQRLARQKATHDKLDLVLALYVNARCGVARQSPWSPPRPQPSVVRGEVGAIVGLMRLAILLPSDPKGTIPRTRRAMRKCGCCQKHDASPRSYTFAWELEAAWRLTLDHSDPTAVSVWGLCATAVSLLLRPKYARGVVPAELSAVVHRGGWQLTWQRDDKGRPAARPPSAPALRWVPEAGLPARHPRITAAGGPLIRRAIATAKAARPPGYDRTPLFCRVERARTQRAPKGAVARPWVPVHGARREPVPAFWWPHARLSPPIIKRHLVRFLTPLIGHERAKKRVLSGCRGGGEMELEKLGAPLPVRATVGWWKARLLALQGALVTYEGASVEDMIDWTARQGSTYMRVLAPGVYTTTPPMGLYRSISCRQHHRSMHSVVIARAKQAREAAARRDGSLDG